ncbi:MAG: acyl-CoA thioesterase [Hellea sp.]|nr:acyl-CoA thioesterase [Hellea sp.]
MIFRTRKAVKPADLNCQNTLFGGRLLSWIDEECGIYCACQMQTKSIITKSMSEINFKSPAYLGDVIEIGVETVEVRRPSLTVSCTVRDKVSGREIVKIDRITFVAVNEAGKPVRHALSHLAGGPRKDDQPASLFADLSWMTKLVSRPWKKPEAEVDTGKERV